MFNIPIKIAFLLLILSCFNKKVESVNKKEEFIGHINNSMLNAPIIQSNKFIFHDTIIDIGKSSFRIYQDTSKKTQLKFKILKKEGNNWIINIDEGWTSLYEFKDWNMDGYTDIILRYHHAYVVILYNPKMEYFAKFGDIGELTNKVEKIEGTNLMCNLDEHKNWSSELFDIDPNYNKRSYGIMVNWDESDTENNRENLKVCVYKRLLIFNKSYDNQTDRSILGTNKKLISKIDLSKIEAFNDIDFEKHDSLRLDFAKKYWTENWRKFVSN